MSATHHVGPRRSSEPVILRRGNPYRVWWSVGSHEAQFVGVFLGSLALCEGSDERALAFCEESVWTEFRTHRAGQQEMNEAADKSAVVAKWILAEKPHTISTLNPTDIAMIRPTFSAWA